MRRPSIAPALLVPALTLAGLLAPSCSLAQDDALNVEQAGEKIALRVAQVVGNAREVFVRDFRASASSNVAITKAIADALVRRGFRVQAGAAIEIEGRLRPLENATGYSVATTVVFADGRERRFTQNVANELEQVAFTGETGEQRVPPGANIGARMQANDNKFILSKATIQGNVVRPAPDSPYGVEVFVESGRSLVPVTPRIQNGLVHITLKKGQIYAIRARNDADVESAISVHIDGLSRFAVADDSRRTRDQDLVGKKSSRVVRGWFRDGRSVDSFLVGAYSESVAARLLPDSPELGTIAVVFSAAWQESEFPPPHEVTPIARLVDVRGPDGRTFKKVVFSVRGSENPPVGTAQGPSRAEATETVARRIGKPRAVVKIRYSE